MGILIFIFLFFLSVNAFCAQEELSLVPYISCKLSPKAPSKSVLEKNYRTYMPVGIWHIFDINGDGLCDWIRNGREGFRYDIDVVPMIEMIYLGTSSGWRKFETRSKSQAMNNKMEEVDRTLVRGFGDAIGFYQPFPVYRKGYGKPFVVVVERIDGPAPPPDTNKIDVLEWDDDFDSLRVVNGEGRENVVRFLRSSFCGRAQIPEYDGVTLIIASGNLCDGKKR
jgi:hypothetical protein